MSEIGNPVDARNDRVDVGTSDDVRRLALCDPYLGSRDEIVIKEVKGRWPSRGAPAEDSAPKRESTPEMLASAFLDVVAAFMHRRS